jgi:superfamily I DNA and RNA helicase
MGRGADAAAELLDAVTKGGLLPGTEATSRRSVAVRVTLNDVTLKLTLTPKFLARSITDAIVNPFIGAYNRKKESSLTADDIARISLDGRQMKGWHPRVQDGLDEKTTMLQRHALSAPSGDLLTADEHVVKLSTKPDDGDDDDD